MMHLSDDQIYDLSIKVLEEVEFTASDIQRMKHMAQCEDCYQMLCCVMAMRDVSNHLGDFLQTEETLPVQSPVRNSITAAIRVVIDSLQPILKQVNEGLECWTFCKAPVALAGVRSGRKKSAVHKLIDSDNSRTYIAYDPVKKLLVIQIDSRDCEIAPTAYLKEIGGECKRITFGHQDGLYRAELQGCLEGEYELILQK